MVNTKEIIDFFKSTHKGEYRFDTFNNGIYAIDIIAESTVWDNDWDETYPSHIPVYMFSTSDELK